MDNSSGNKRIAKNTIALYIRMGITMIVTFITTRVTLEVLGVEDYGLNNLVASVVSLFGFINGSMGTAVQRFYSIEIGKNREENLSRVFGTALYLHLIVGIITIIIAEIFAIFFLHKLNIPQERIFAAQMVLQISIFSLFLNILNVPYAALLRAREEFSRIAILDIIQVLLRLGVLYLLYTINFDKLITLSVLNSGVTLFYVITITIIARKYKETEFQIKRDREYVKKMLNFVSMLLFTVLASLIDKQGIIILVNLFFGLTINAAYAIAFQVSTAIETFAMSFKQSVVPQLMQAYGANDTNRMNGLIFLGTKITFFLMLLISIPIIFEVDLILNFWLTEPPEFASIFVILLIISANINVFAYFVYQGVHASGKIMKQQTLTSITYLVSVVCIYIVFKLGGNFYYAGYLPIFFSIIRNIVTVISAKESINFNVKFFLKEVILPCLFLVLLIVISMIAVTSFIADSPFRFIFIFTLTCILIVLFGYYIVLNDSERKSMKAILLKIK